MTNFFRITILLAVLAAGLLLSGCKQLQSGTVIDRKFVPQHSEVTYQAHLEMWLPETIPDAYYITIAGMLDGRHSQRKIKVSKEEYECYTIGTVYP